MDKVHVALVANERYRPGLLCTRHSMSRACADPSRLVFHEFGDADMAPFLSRVEMKDFNGSKLPYLRLFLPELLPDCEWVIYSDVDTLWFRDPCELWDERDESVSVCWVKDLDLTGMDFERWTASKNISVARKGVYACSGVALINLKKWREADFTRRAVDFLRTYGTPQYPDQDLMNVLLSDDSKLIDPTWDVIVPPSACRPCVFHINGMGLRLLGSDHYDGNVPQYIFWFNYYRQNILRQPAMVQSTGRRIRLHLLACLSCLLLPSLEFLDGFRLSYAAKLQILRFRRQLSYARYALGKIPCSSVQGQRENAGKRG